MATRPVVAASTWQREVLHDVLPVVLATRTLLLGLTVLIPLAHALLGVPPLAIDHTNGTGTILDVWNRWDTRWYDDLAQVGYNLHGPNGYKNVVFFPLYPLLIRALHDAMALFVRGMLGVALPDPTYPPFIVPALIVANLCSIAMLVFFYNLVRLDYGREVARRAVTLLALYPLSFFLGAAYSEGTYLLCAVACLYALRLERWWQAGLWGLLATATRPPGIVLLAPFLMAWAAAHPSVVASLRARARAAWRALTTSRPNSLHIAVMPRRVLLLPPRNWSAQARAVLRHTLPAMAVPGGLVLFMAYQYWVFGNPFLFIKAQDAWWRTFAPPWETLYLGVTRPLADILHGTPNIWDPSALHDLTYAIGGLIVTWLARRRLPRAQVIYMWLLWVLLLSSPAMLPEAHTGEPHRDVLMSLPRMLLMLFPLFTYLGLQRRMYPYLAGLFAFALAVYAGVFVSGAWIA